MKTKSIWVHFGPLPPRGRGEEGWLEGEVEGRLTGFNQTPFG